MLFRRLLSFLVLLAGVHSGAATLPPVDEITLSLRQTVGGDYEIIMRNNASGRLYYFGYGGPAAGHPVVVVEFQKDGVWKGSPPALMGPGFGECFLRPGEEHSFSFSIDRSGIKHEEKFRMALSVYHFVGDERQTFKICSNAVTWSSESRANQPAHPTATAVTPPGGQESRRP